ncbi:MAG: FAD:protein FMN transferase, partial [Thermoguttaceae bacterium]
FTKPGVEISLGCVGKGYALDATGKIMTDNGVTDFIVHGDLSSVLARGGSPTEQSKPESGWRVGIAHPMLPGERLTEICLRDQSIGTSGSQKQFFRHKGRRFSHILDPRTGFPAETNLLVTVIADTAVEADILSTAFFVMNTEQIEKYCQTHPSISVIAVTATDQAPGYSVVNIGRKVTSK